MCVCVCVCVCARSCEHREHSVTHSYTHTHLIDTRIQILFEAFEHREHSAVIIFPALQHLRHLTAHHQKRTPQVIRHIEILNLLPARSNSSLCQFFFGDAYV